MNRKLGRAVGALAAFAASGSGGAERAQPWAEGAGGIVCVGRVEPEEGEIEVCAHLAGTLVAVRAREGERFTRGAVLAEVEASREAAALAIAEARLARVRAGNGREEIAAALARHGAVAAELALAESEHRRAAQLRESGTIAADEFERRRLRVEALRRQAEAAQKDSEALQRGARPEEIAVAEAEVAAAKAAYELRLVRAPSDGEVLALHRHTGDYVALTIPTPILRFANTQRLRVRLEIGEADAQRIKAGMKGGFGGATGGPRGGQLIVRTVLPAYSPRRLFEPDATALVDTRVRQALCDIEGPAGVVAGQRVIAVLGPASEPKAR